MIVKKLKLYIETSVWNFLFADDAPEKMRDTILFFDRIAGSEDYELYISELVNAEIDDAPEHIKNMLRDEIEKLEPEELEITVEARNLAGKYAEANLVPQKAYRDLIHLAVATVNNMDFLISWNLSHIVRAKTMVGVNAINILEGYRDIKICTVLEVLS
jgi:hypothetical protein